MQLVISDKSLGLLEALGEFYPQASWFGRFNAMPCCLKNGVIAAFAGTGQNGEEGNSARRVCAAVCVNCANHLIKERIS